MELNIYKAPEAHVTRFAGESVLCASVSPIDDYEPSDLGSDEF